MTLGLVAARFFGGCFQHALHYLYDARLIPQRIDKSRLNRRLHALQTTFAAFFAHIRAQPEAEGDAVFALDTMPLIAVQNARIPRARIYTSVAYHGYNATKKTFFRGLKLHLVVNTRGRPVEAALVPAAVADVRGYELLPLGLVPGSIVTADKAYNAKTQEVALLERGITVLPLRKKNMTTCPEAHLRAWVSKRRKVVETAFSRLSSLLPKSIRAVTGRGFELKATLFVLVLTLISQ
ncbi:MAG: IS982 family transposase [Bacteroidetes bacterium]|nr:IS982 family transposase [Bacteroidota bacterium]